jgi:hypothetical protein
VSSPAAFASIAKQAKDAAKTPRSAARA